MCPYSTSQVNDVDPVLQTVRNAVANAGPVSQGAYLRVFALGIGDGASPALCEGIARAGNGISLMTVQSEEIATRCSNLLHAARHPPIATLFDISFDWGYKPTLPPKFQRPMSIQWEEPQPFRLSVELTDEKSALNPELREPKLVLQAPSSTPEIFPQHRFIVSAILSGTTVVPKQVSISGKLTDGSKFSMPVPVQEVRTTYLLHTLAARRLITELQDGDISSLDKNMGEDDDELRETIIKEAVEKLSVNYQLASRYAAFVAVESDVDKSVEEHDDTSPGTVEIDDEDTPETKQSTEAGGGDDDQDDVYDDSDASMKTNIATEEYIVDEGNKTDRGDRCTNTSEQRPSQMWLSAATQLYEGASHVSRLASTFFGFDIQDTSGSARETTSYVPGPGDFWAFFHLDALAHVLAQAAMVSAGPMVFTSARLAMIAPSLHPDPERDAGLDRRFYEEVFREKPLPLAPIARIALEWKGPATSQAATPPVAAKSPDGGVAGIARLQSFDGSFALDVDLVNLLGKDRTSQNDTTLSALRNAIPDSISSIPRADAVWATVLAIAYLKTRMPDEMNVWMKLAQKAMQYVLQTIGGDVDSFSQLVYDAEELI